MTSLLLETDLSDEQQEFARTTERSTRDLLALINDILDFSKIEAGQLTLEAVSMDLRESVEDVAEILAPRAAEKGVELAVRFVPGTPRHLVGDPVRIRQIVTNLAGNAVKFTDQGHVLVQVEEEKSSAGGRPRIRLSVEDTGIGIEPENLARVFEKFEQADASTTRRFGGTGLGLSICRELSELMDGEIRAQSRPGRGSTFWVSVHLGLDPERDAAPGRPAFRSEPSALVVSSSPLLRMILKEELEAKGVTVGTATTPREGLEVLQASAERGVPFSLALLDEALGEGELHGAMQEIRADAGLRDLLLVRLTRSQLAHGAAQGSGFDLDLPKPLLERRVGQVLRLLEWGRKGQPSGAGTGEGSGEAPPDRKPVEILGGRVLLVEDDEMNREVAAAMLRKIGVTMRAAEDGLKALEILENESFDLILMDCQMPGMDGFETTARVRAREDNGFRVPILALTAAALQGDRERCLAAGMDDYLSKPLTLGQLRDMLRQWLPSPPSVARACRSSTGPPPSAGWVGIRRSSCGCAPCFWTPGPKPGRPLPGPWRRGMRRRSRAWLIGPRGVPVVSPRKACPGSRRSSRPEDRSAGCRMPRGSSSDWTRPWKDSGSPSQRPPGSSLTSRVSSSEATCPKPPTYGSK